MTAARTLATGLAEGPRALLLVLIVLILAAQPMPASADGRERIRIVGSETVFPLAVAAAEAFSVKTRFVTPVVEANGSEVGFALFCAGKGVQHPDMATAVRPMTRSELAKCRQRGISVAEIKFGHRAVVLAQSRRGQAVSLTRQQIFKALAAEVPIDGKAVINPYKLWSDIDFALPVKPIAVAGPAPLSRDRKYFGELIMAPAAQGLMRVTSRSAAKEEKGSPGLRADGVFSATDHDVQTLSRLVANPDALGVVGFTFLQQNADSLQATQVDGVTPSAVTIATGAYGPSSPFFLYVKRENLRVIPGIQDYVAEITSEAASGDQGYLVQRGLIPLPPAERAALQDTARQLSPIRN